MTFALVVALFVCFIEEVDVGNGDHIIITVDHMIHIIICHIAPSTYFVLVLVGAVGFKLMSSVFDLHLKMVSV